MKYPTYQIKCKRLYNNTYFNFEKKFHPSLSDRKLTKAIREYLNKLPAIDKESNIVEIVKTEYL